MYLSDEGILTDVTETKEGIYLTSLAGVGVFISKEQNTGKVVPKVGDHIEVYCHSGSTTVQRVVVDGKIIKDMSDKELSEDRKRIVEDINKRNIAEYAEYLKTKKERYDKLPDCLKKEIDEFSDNDPNDPNIMELYTMGICEQGVVVFEKIKTEDQLTEFSKLSFEQQKEMVPGLDDGHSGMSFNLTLGCVYKLITNGGIQNG